MKEMCLQKMNLAFFMVLVISFFHIVGVVVLFGLGYESMIVSMLMHLVMCMV